MVVNEVPKRGAETWYRRELERLVEEDAIDFVLDDDGTPRMIVKGEV